jgi:hypothetical protein
MDSIIPYLDQLEARAKALGLELKDVCKAEGIADTTLARWKANETTVRQGTAEALMRRMDEMAKERAA